MQGAAPAASIDAQEAEAWLHAPVPGQFVWLHFNLSNAASERWLRAHAGLPDEFYETLHQGSRSTRIEMADDALIAVVNDVLHNFNVDAAEISTLWVHVTPHGVISARRKPLESIERLRQDVLNGVPLAQHPHGFWVVLGFTALVTGGLAWLLLRLQRPR